MAPSHLLLLGTQITFLPGRLRHGMLANQAFAIRHVCTRPESVVVTLDADDALLGTDALSLIHKAHFQVSVLSLDCNVP